MSLRVLTRKAKMELMAAEGDICNMLFPSKKAQHVCRLFLEHLKRRGGLTRSELSQFTWNLQTGKIEKGLLTLGLVAIEQRFVCSPEQDLAPERRRHRDVVEKYVPVRQPIPKRPPDGLNLPRLMWNICKCWNDEFLEKKYGLM
jgi:hypothetical protein